MLACLAEGLQERKSFFFFTIQNKDIHTERGKKENTNLTISVLEDDLIVLEEKFGHDVRIFPVQPERSLGR